MSKQFLLYPAIALLMSILNLSANANVMDWSTFEKAKVVEISRIYDGGSTRYSVALTGYNGKTESGFILDKVHIGQPLKWDILFSKDPSFKKFVVLSREDMQALKVLINNDNEYSIQLRELLSKRVSN